MVHKNVEKLLEVTFTSLDLALHQSGILQVMEFAQNLQEKVSSLKPAPRQPKDRYASTQDPTDRLLATIAEEDNMLLKPVVQERKSSRKIIMLKLVARMENLSVSLANPERDLTTFTLQGVRLDVMMMKEQIEIESALTTLHVKDCNPTTIFPRILESEGAQALTAKVIMFENPAQGMPQMSVQAQMACFRIFFLNKYVSSLLVNKAISPCKFVFFNDYVVSIGLFEQLPNGIECRQSSLGSSCSGSKTEHAAGL
jgi:hypothetical protein